MPREVVTHWTRFVRRDPSYYNIPFCVFCCGWRVKFWHDDLLAVTCKNCLREAAKLAGLSKETPPQIIHDKLLEEGKL